MIILGIESTAHTFGIGIIDSLKKEILFNEKIQFSGEEGMDLRKLSDYHISNFNSILKKSKIFLNSINKSFNNIDLIAFSQGPGIGNSLKIGSLVAKTLSLEYDIPIVGVNHIRAHLEIGKMLTGFNDPMFLYVSGVNTQIIAKDGNKNYKIFGETEDIGLGNLLDSFARYVGLEFPGGPKIEKLALKSSNYIELPYSVKGMNVSFGGMLSNLKEKFDKGINIEDLCYSLQECAFAMLMEIVERAIAYTKKKEFLIVGGVGANNRLKEMAEQLCNQRGCKYSSFDIQYAMDNGVMIAWQGYLDKSRAKKNINGLKPLPYIDVEFNF